MPVLPVALLDFINAPVPFIMGVLSENINQAILDPELICVDLDRNVISGGNSIPELPRKEWAKLRKSIDTYANVFSPNNPNLGQYYLTESRTFVFNYLNGFTF